MQRGCEVDLETAEGLGPTLGAKLDIDVVQMGSDPPQAGGAEDVGLNGETVHGSAWVGLQLLVHHEHHRRHSQRERWELGVNWVALGRWRNKGQRSGSERSAYPSLPSPRGVLIILTYIEDDTQQLMANFHGFLQNARRVVVCHGVLSKLRCQALPARGSHGPAMHRRSCGDHPYRLPMSVMSQSSFKAFHNRI